MILPAVGTLGKDFTRVEVRGVELRLAPKTPYLRAKQELDQLVWLGTLERTVDDVTCDVALPSKPQIRVHHCPLSIVVLTSSTFAQAPLGVCLQ